MNTKLVNQETYHDEAQTNLGPLEDNSLQFSDFYVTFPLQTCLSFPARTEMDNWKVALKQQIL